MATYTTLGNPAEHLEHLEEIGVSHESTRWTINRRAEVGDELLIYLSAPISAFVVRGIVASVPSQDTQLNGENWPDHYMADIDDVSLLPQRIHIKILRAQFPEWGWLASPIQSTRVPDGVLDRLRALIGSTPADTESEEFPDVDEESFEAFEGDPRLELHFRRERSRRLIDAKRAAVLEENGQLACEVCGFDFAAEYGLAEPYCEIHHLTPIAQMNPGAKTTLADLAVLCSNCHRVIHRRVPMLTPQQLATQIRARRDPAASKANRAK